MKYTNNIPPEEWERIESYLDQQMEESEVAAFINELNTNEALRRNTEEIRLLRLGIQEGELKQRLKQFHKQLQPPKKEKPVFFMKKLAIAASLIIVFGSALWLLFLSPGNKNKKLYGRYYTPDPGLATVMSNTANNYEFEKAMVEYKNKEYKKALASWESLLSQKKNNDTIIYFIGAAKQASGKEEEAIAYLQQIADNTNSAFNKDACWYLGLCFIKKSDQPKAIHYLEKSGYPKAPGLINAIHKQ